MSVVRACPSVHDSLKYSHGRRVEAEDDNIAAAEGIRRRNKLKKMQHLVDRCCFRRVHVQKPTNFSAPEKRAFRWMISAHHLPEECHAESAGRYPPWYLLLRCILVDLPEQLKGGIEISLPESNSNTSWRNYQVLGEGETANLLRRVSPCRAFPRVKWGRRIVFSQQSREKPRWLRGDWLFVAYLWSDNREWLRGADAASLISFENAFCIRAYEKVHCLTTERPIYRPFYQSEKLMSDGPSERLVTLFDHITVQPGLYPPPIPPGAPVTRELAKLRRLMDTRAVDLLYGDVKTRGK